MNLKSVGSFISSNLKILFLSIAIGLFACAISIFAFSSPGSNQPPNGNPTFWFLNGTSMYYSGGNVGVGTTNPGAKISVTASANSMIAGFTGGNAAGIYPSYDGSLYLSQNFSGGFAEQDIWNTLSPTLYPSTGIRFLQQTATSSYADLLFLKNNGNVGIGTATPGYPLTIYSASTSTLWLGNPGGARRNVWYYFRCMGRSQQGLENL